MQVALIPPIAHLNTFRASNFHLVLSHVMTDHRYRDFYRERRLHGDYLILDNGAHENTSGEDMRKLLLNAGLIRASEIVLPDTLFDWKETVAGAERALSYLLGAGQQAWGLSYYPRIMIVPQGKSFDEWKECFNDLTSLLAHAFIKRGDLFGRSAAFTVGVSKDYEVWEGGIPTLLEFLQPFRDWLDFDVHLLGWGRRLLQLAVITRDFPWVRSTDSAKPFVYAMHGISLEGMFVEADVPEYPKRDDHYFHRRMDHRTLDLAQRNVEVFLEFAGAHNATSR